MQNQQSWIRRLLPVLERQGWTWRKGKGHLVIYPPDKTRASFAISSSPSDRYGQKNAIKQLRKAGANI